VRERKEGKPLLIVVSAPSGAGKTTLCERLIEERPDISYSVSCTTRSPRGEEVEGRDYIFLSHEQFQRRIESGDFLEYAQVHGHWYGTLRATVENSLSSGKSVLMDIDVQGARQIRGCVARAAHGDPIKEGFVDIFIAPPSIDVLRARLVKRGEDGAAEIDVRLRNAQEEMRCSVEYRHCIVNDDLVAAHRRLTAILADAAAKSG